MDKLSNYLNSLDIENLNVPIEFTNTIKGTLYYSKRKADVYYSYLKKIASIIIALIVTGGITVFAFIKYFDLKDFGINDFGINKAINNGYIQKIDMEYIEQQDIQCKIDYLLLDDIDFDLVFNFKFKDDISNYEGFSIPNLLITDENNNQLFLDTEEKEHEKSFATSMGWKVIEKDEYNIRQLLFLKSSEFPKCKKIYLKFNKVILYNVNKGKPFTKSIEGNWNIEIETHNKFIKRKTIKYVIDKSYKDNQFELLDAKLLNTGFLIKFKSDLITEDVTIKLFDENGKRYSLVDSNILSDNSNEYIMTFDMTQYDYQTDLYFEILKNNTNLMKVKLVKNN